MSGIYVGKGLKAWSSSDTDYYTESATPAVGDKLFDEDGEDTGLTISAVGSGYIEFFIPNTIYDSTRASHRDIDVVDDGSYSFAGAGSYNSNVSGSLNFYSLTSIENRDYFYRAFRNCTEITSASFQNLTTISVNLCCGEMFDGCTKLTSVSFESLTNINSGGILHQAFYGCEILEDIYFKALTTSSFFDKTDQFYKMMSGTGTNKIHKLHFPSNLQSTIAGLSDYPLFGGSEGYVQCLFDLPATS